MDYGDYEYLKVETVDRVATLTINPIRARAAAMRTKFRLFMSIGGRPVVAYLRVVGNAVDRLVSRRQADVLGDPRGGRVHGHGAMKQVRRLVVLPEDLNGHVIGDVISESVEVSSRVDLGKPNHRLPAYLADLPARGPTE